jgi:hypothetical protein
LVLILVKNMKWHLNGHKSLEYQFEGYWEPCFNENVKNTKWHLVGHKKGLNFNLRVIENRVSKMWSDIWLVTKGWNINLRVIENHFQSIHFICMNNDFVSHEIALPTGPNCLPLIKKGLIRHVT